MVGLNSSFQIWTKLRIQNRAKVKKLMIQLCTPNNDCSFPAYLLDIKKSVDIGAPIFTEDHVEAILDGLPEEYDSLVASVLSRVDRYTVEELETLLLS